MWTDILPNKQYAIDYIKALRVKYPYDDIHYRVGQRPINSKFYWGIYNPSIGCYEFVWVPQDG